MKNDIQKLFSFILLIFAFLIFLSSCSKEKSQRQPNIIFLLTDDHRFDGLGVTGNKTAITPHLDQLANDGVRFRNAYVTTSICCTSRAGILSGQYARRHGINDFVTGFSDAAWMETYPALLKEAGYKTGFVGKFGVGNEEDMPKHTFDYWKGFGGWGYYETQDEHGNDIHLTRLIGDQSVEFLTKFSDKGPFCLSVSFKAPHCQDGDPRQFIFDPEYSAILADVTIPEEPTNKDEYYYRFSEKFRERNEARHRWEIRFSTPEKYQEMVKGYYRLIYGADVVVGRIREKLAELGIEDNTVIIFTGDNGFYLGEYGLAGKWFGHEESIKVPLLVYDPRNSNNNSVLNEMALNIDIAPTILDLAGIAVPERMQGKSLMNLINNKNADWRDEFFYEHQFIRAEWGHKPYIPGVEGIVTQDYKLMNYFHGGDTIVFEELFDMNKNHSELNNLSDNEEYRQLKNELNAVIVKYKNELR